MGSGAELARLLEYVDERHPRSRRGIDEARATAPGRFDEIAGMYLRWASAALGERSIERCVDAFVQFSHDVNFAQARYERDGHYRHKTHAECNAELYSRDEMADYLWGVYLTNFLWAHHLEIGMMFRDDFVATLAEDVEIVELAPGHGGWGAWALHALPAASLRGIDISPSAMTIASSIAEAAGASGRARYEQADVLTLAGQAPGSADACICCFLLEHLEQPDKLFEIIGEILRPGGRAFITGALTAAQVDHIYEFRRESELVKLAEDHGLRVTHTLSVGPRRTLPRARFLPRSMALLVHRRTGDTW